MYYVNWDEAVDFCAKLSAKEGKPYRLPTEAEWEYAARAGSVRATALATTLTSLAITPGTPTTPAASARFRHTLGHRSKGLRPEAPFQWLPSPSRGD